MIFENSLPKANFGQNIRDSPNGSLTADSRSLQTATLKSSIFSVKRADAAADLAAKQIELDAFQAKAKHKEVTARLEAELARRKALLEQMEINEQIQMANARLNAYQEIDKEEEEASFVENQPVAEDERNMSIEPYHKHLYQQPYNPRIESTPRSDNTAASAAAIAAAITDSISMSRLPVPEPIIFKGDPIEYSDWKSSFYALVDRKCISASDKMYYLRRYIEGPAEEAICGLFLHGSKEAYDRAWKILDERFGNPFVITKGVPK
ncbi:uncharacterized protein [Montipora capricornis]|uniref:uncharacterized protein n=1 Tax=Montipora capricornis TaxID=246305 RepID=UPI0035F14020